MGRIGAGALDVRFCLTHTTNAMNARSTTTTTMMMSVVLSSIPSSEPALESALLLPRGETVGARVPLGKVGGGTTGAGVGDRVRIATIGSPESYDTPATVTVMGVVTKLAVNAETCPSVTVGLKITLTNIPPAGLAESTVRTIRLRLMPIRRATLYSTPNSKLPRSNSDNADKSGDTNWMRMEWPSGDVVGSIDVGGGGGDGGSDAELAVDEDGTTVDVTRGVVVGILQQFACSIDSTSPTETNDGPTLYTSAHVNLPSRPNHWAG